MNPLINIGDLSFENFLERNKISVDDWQSAKIKWTDLKNIGMENDNKKGSFSAIADSYAKRIQSFDKVHSVRWRIKNSEHLMEKIIRKRLDKVSKYNEINVGNFTNIVYDLIGVRALHLFKNDSLDIHKSLKEQWSFSEKPIVYIRDGDSSSAISYFADSDFKIAKHPKGYRSIHYILEHKLGDIGIKAELQVRTLFEEGWSEIDHVIRYPNFSNHYLTEYFLKIFNQLAGSADEMGTFVNDLKLNIESTEFEKKELNDVLDKIRNTNTSEEEVKELKNKVAFLTSSSGDLKRVLRDAAKVGTHIDPEVILQLERAMQMKSYLWQLDLPRK